MGFSNNPFYILGVSSRDNRTRISEKVEACSLKEDPSKCSRLRSELLNPRKRLSAEMAWFPGVAPKRISEMLALLNEKPDEILTVDNLPPLSRDNLLASGIMRLENPTPEVVAEWILKIAQTFEEIEPAEQVAIINEERIVSGFPEIRDISFVEEEIENRRRFYRQAIRDALDKLPTDDLIKAVTLVIEETTNLGEWQAEIIVDDLVDSYEVEARVFLDKEEAKINALVENIRHSAKASVSKRKFDSLIRQLSTVVRNWDRVAQPIQVSAKSRGLEHEPSKRIASLVRELAVVLYNEHGELEYSQKLTNLLQEVFAEVVIVAERAAEDVSALNEIAERKQMQIFTDPISDLCKTAFDKAGENPSLADKEARKIIEIVPPLLSKISANKKIPNHIVVEVKNEVAMTLMHCAVTYGNETEKWSPCMEILEIALGYASDKEIEERITKNLEIVRNNARNFEGLTPITSAPSLSTYNGIGFTLYGATDHQPWNGSHISTYYFVFFGIPVFPLSRYRVIPIQNGYRFIGKAPLRSFDIVHIAVSAILILLGFLSLQN